MNYLRLDEKGWTIMTRIR